MAASVSDEDICNRALARLGILRQVGVLASDDTRDALACRTLLTAGTGNLKRLVLRLFPWPFATRFQELVIDDTASTQVWSQAGWTYNWVYPSSTVKVRRVLNSEGKRPAEAIPFEVWAETTSAPRVFSNHYDLDPDDDVTKRLYVETTHDVTDQADWSIEGDEALVLLLANQLSYALDVDAQKRAEVRQDAALWMSVAQRIAIAEEQEQKAPDGEFIRGRFG